MKSAGRKGEKHTLSQMTGFGFRIFFYRTLLKGVKIDMIDIIEQNLLIGTGFQASEGFHQLQNIADLRKTVTWYLLCHILYNILASFCRSFVDAWLLRVVTFKP